MKSPLVGPAYQALSQNLSFQQCINLFLESMEGPNGAEPRALFGCPGLTLGVTLPSGPVRAMHQFNGVMYVIAGSLCYSLDSSLAFAILGGITTSSGPAYITFNDRQVGFFDRNGLSVYNILTTAFAPVTLPFGNVGVPATLDTLTVCSEVGTYNIWQSDPNDMTTWDPLNFTTEDGNAQPIVAIISIHDNLVILKTLSMCFYVNEGNPGFVFGRLPGIYPRTGCVSASGFALVGEDLIWVGQNEEGGPRIFLLEGYEARPVSTYAIDNTISQFSVQNATAFGYIQEGHPFYVVNFPAGDQTWVFDPKETSKLKVPVWHQRAAFGEGVFTRYAGSAACQIGGNVYMGDWQNGNIYRLDLTNFTDNGAMRKWLRSWRAIPAEAQYQTQKANFLDIQMDTGLGVAPDEDPQLMLRQSFDTYSWGAERLGSAGKTGETAFDVRFTRLGATRRGLNSDRVFELSSTDPFKTALLGAELE